jgi:large subunit ribosomal protein L3
VAVGLLGNKIGMTQIFDESGNIIPVTILKVGPCVITQLKTKSKDGYNSIQIGYGNVSSQIIKSTRIRSFTKIKYSTFKIFKRI